MNCFCGHSKISITPEFKVSLAGYAHRTGKYETVRNDIFIRALYFQDDINMGKLIISADLIWWDSSITDDLKSILENKYKIKKNNIIFNATHTHCAPQTSYNFTPSLGMPNGEYIIFIKEQALKAVKNAVNNKERCIFYIKSTTCEIGINRRLFENGMIEMAPNPDGVNETEVKILEIRNFKNKLISILVHGVCHANVSAENCISPDFPGIAMSMIEEKYSKATAIYLQGFCGDIRPNIVSEENKFIRSNNNKAVEIAKKLAGKIIITVDDYSNKQVYYRDKDGLENNFIPDFQQYPTLLQLKQIIDIEEKKENPNQLLEWAETMIKKSHFRKEKIASVRIQILPITDKFILMGINSEIVLDYHIYIKNKFGDQIIPIAYVNGMIGYIATKEQITEGGYEADEMYQYFALPSQFDSNIEKKLKEQFESILQEY